MIKNKIIKLSLAVYLFLSWNISYADISCLRIPINNLARMGYAIRLKGGTLDEKENRLLEIQISKSIDDGRAWALFRDRDILVAGDKKIPQYPQDTKFLQDLRKKEKELAPGFDIIIVSDITIPIDLVLHPGHKRNQAYLPLSTLITLEQMYKETDDTYKSDFIDMLFEAFKHEEKHVGLKSEIKNKSPPEIERIIETNAPSFRAVELFRLAYLKQRLPAELKPNLNRFFKNVRESDKKASHMFAYEEMDDAGHLSIADALLKKTKPEQIDIILAQHHIGCVLSRAVEKPGGINSVEFKKAIIMLKKKNIIDIGPETKKPYPVYKFARELIFAYRIATIKSPADINVIIKSLEELEPWERGDQENARHSVRMPIPGETTALPINLERAKNVISSLSIEKAGKDRIISELRTNDKGQVIIKYEVLKEIGETLYGKAVSTTSGAGAGTRFALVLGFNENDSPIFHDQAKGVLKIPLEEGVERSFIEMFLAQSAYINHNSHLENKIPNVIYTSHFTDKDVTAEIERLGYQLIEKHGNTQYYKHSDPNYGELCIVRLHKTALINRANGDFLARTYPDIEWDEAHWPHAHDAAIVDYITSGLAYEFAQQGKIYVDISNIDNRANSTDPVILAIMELTGAALLNEIAPKQPEERGGGAPVKLKKPFIEDSYTGNLERPNMKPGLEKSLTAEQTAKYLSQKNTANNCLNIIEYVKDVLIRFYKPEGEITDEEAMALLKEFYEARSRPEEQAKLQFEKIGIVYRTNPRFMFLEQSKRYAQALQVGSLLGAHTWLTSNKIFLEVPTGADAGLYSRFEEQKDNIINLGNMKKALESIAENYQSSGIESFTVNDILKESITNEQRAWLKYAVKALGADYGTNFRDLMLKCSEIYSVQLGNIERIIRPNRYYPGQHNGIENTAFSANNRIDL